jgi:hypothetical protein
MSHVLFNLHYRVHDLSKDVIHTNGDKSAEAINRAPTRGGLFSEFFSGEITLF